MMRHSPSSLARMLTESCRMYPGNTSVVFGKRKLTYRELGAEVEKLAVRIIRLGVIRGDCVGVLLSNSPEFVISYFAGRA